jgi:hypothetical protein
MFRADLKPASARQTELAMRQETLILVDEIKQAIGLLRRHL